MYEECSFFASPDKRLARTKRFDRRLRFGPRRKLTDRVPDKLELATRYNPGGISKGDLNRHDIISGIESHHDLLQCSHVVLVSGPSREGLGDERRPTLDLPVQMSFVHVQDDRRPEQGTD